MNKRDEARKRFERITRDAARVIEDIADGRDNAKPIEVILATLQKRHDWVLSRGYFQQRVKPALWEAGYPVGTSNRGLFICKTAEELYDAEFWYQHRIAALKTNKTKLQCAFYSYYDDAN